MKKATILPICIVATLAVTTLSSCYVPAPAVAVRPGVVAVRPGAVVIRPGPVVVGRPVARPAARRVFWRR